MHKRPARVQGSCPLLIHKAAIGVLPARLRLGGRGNGAIVSRCARQRVQGFLQRCRHKYPQPVAIFVGYGTRSDLVVEFIMLHFIVPSGLFVLFSLSCTYVQQVPEKGQSIIVKLVLESGNYSQMIILSCTVPFKIMPQYFFLTGICVPNLHAFCYHSW